MTICFFGIYDPNYSRNRVLISGLKQNGADIIECRTDLRGVKKYFDLIKKHWKIRKDYDVLFVAFPGYQSVVLAWLLTRKTIVFDAFASIYDSEVCDRKTTKKGGLRAKYFWFLDWLSCRLADKILLDTKENIKYFVNEFGVGESKFVRVFVGTLAEEYSSGEQLDIFGSIFTVCFYGTFIPLQGMSYILEASKLLEKHKDIQFTIVGSKLKEIFSGTGFNSVEFKGQLSYDDLVKFIQKSDVCLGIFGDTTKTQRVIPNKVYDYVAMKKPVITADTPAIRELFDENDLVLVPVASPHKLVQVILKLKDNEEAREKLAQNAYNKFIKNCTPEIITKKLLDEIKI